MGNDTFVVSLDSSCGFRRNVGRTLSILELNRTTTITVQIVEVLDRFHVRVKKVEGVSHG